MENQPALIEVPPNTAPVIPTELYVGKPRPLASSEEVRKAAIEKLLPEVMQWGRYDEDEADSVLADLISAVKWNGKDTYQMAKHLEDRAGWDPDSELVELLEGLDIYGCHREAVRAWIKDNSIAPAFEVGREVLVKERRQSEMLTGKISSLTEDGMYCVNVPSLGHVESGVGCHGILFPWEDVEVWNTAAESV